MMIARSFGSLISPAHHPASKAHASSGWPETWRVRGTIFDGGDGGGPLSTLKHASGKDGRELLDLAAEITGTKRDLNGGQPGDPRVSQSSTKST